jgi:RNA polymerase sigma-70 factor (ECF subfamily)
MMNREEDNYADEQLISAARDGDENAFQQLVKKFEPRVAATVIGMLGDCPEAEDVGQEAFIRFYKALGKFRGESRVGTYLTRIAINLSLNELKRRKRKRSLFSASVSGDIQNVPDGKPTENQFETREIVFRALQQLNPEFRSVLVLRILDGYSSQETADILSIPVGTVLSRLARGQKKLRKILTPYLGVTS